MNDRHHPRLNLVETPAVQIDRCGCGAIHVTIGAVTLRLQPEAFAEVAGAIVDARAALDAGHRPARAPGVRLPS